MKSKIRRSQMALRNNIHSNCKKIFASLRSNSRINNITKPFKTKSNSKNSTSQKLKNFPKCSSIATHITVFATELFP